MQYHFPGNVRELEKIIDSAILLEKQKTVQPETIRHRLQLPDSRMQTDYSQLPYREAKKQFERDYFSALLARFDYRVNKTAEFAEMDRSHVTSKLKSLGLRNSDPTSEE
jgi:DNA-binding NtrC family response regulator